MPSTVPWRFCCGCRLVFGLGGPRRLLLRGEAASGDQSGEPAPAQGRLFAHSGTSVWNRLHYATLTALTRSGPQNVTFSANCQFLGSLTTAVDAPNEEFVGVVFGTSKLG